MHRTHRGGTLTHSGRKAFAGERARRLEHAIPCRAGSIVDGDPEQPTEKTDYWTFARDTRSTDPNWVLVATSSG